MVMMVVESSGLLEPWFDKLKNKDNIFLIGAGKISVGINPQHLAECLAHSRYAIHWMVDYKENVR